MEMTGNMSYENAALGYYLYRQLLLTRFLEHLPEVPQTHLSYKPLQKPVWKNVLREGIAKNWQSEQLRAALCGYLTNRNSMSLTKQTQFSLVFSASLSL